MMWISFNRLRISGVTDPLRSPAPVVPTGPARPSLVPPPNWHPRTPLLLGLVFLSLIPALILTFQRVQFEQSRKVTALVMDYPALVIQARRYGQDPQALLNRYKALGVNGVALYEDTVASLQQRGEILLKNGYDLADKFPGAPVKPNAVYMRSVVPGVAESLPARYTIPTHTVTVGGQSWLEWPSDPSYLPAGPNRAQVAEFQRQGMVLVYRPYNDEARPVSQVGTDWPAVPYVAFTDDAVIGARTPELLEQVDRAMGQRIPAVIEGNIQDGLEDLVLTHGGVRLFALAPSWQNQLTPEEIASKYNLAARERSQQLLYLRPFPTINETTDMLARLQELMKNSGIKVGMPVTTAFEPSPVLRWLSIIGPLAALLLAGLSLPLRRLGLLGAAGTLLLCLGLNYATPLAGFALVAAVTFPALGLLLRRSRITDWFIATGLSLVGVVFVSALGATPDSMLGLHPFRGVGLTLLLPLAMVAASFLPKQDIRKTVSDVYNAPIKLGDIAVMGLGLALLGLVYSRRGNATGGSVTEFESSLRQNVQDSMVRPRFKEVAAHPLAILGLSGKLPGYFSGLMLLGGTMGQASILNTFSHFHTPFLISATRCFLGLGLGLLIGLLLVKLFDVLAGFWRSYRPDAAVGPRARA
ncbi:hypothetical protein E5E91_00825 [Deinococcus radiodurans R1 = ATCC 13939 = DSM 20539]|uniref:Uncharacterized protein n=2 Tax=Deinococcus radiodurans TaxID=1299 RepID=Q9RXZ4_DEIRA|nr:hypothetical protein DR_0160 [Deinococcus radiodurans R1 = ATCC 13939 = DSM 20539]QEM72126.1 hypothetical protein DXG80_10420 [Deinococcus radiodurans]UDK99360.1 hypothetical protein E5E91_00825 [Deinococcus radiodurans R1 = ATCC 13939 = DSM 20539]HCE65524.1 hypothetical protein [Deinococcus radiodurans]